MPDADHVDTARDKVSTSEQRWLDELCAGIARQRHEQSRTAAEQAPDFNLFEYLTPDENRLSRTIAQLLDPRATHGQGPLFLNAFLSLQPVAGPRTSAATQWRPPSSPFTGIRLEASTRLISAYRRRKDIEISFSHDVIVIENKPWACEQHEQVGDYLEELDERRRRLQLHGTDVVCCLYYLTVDGLEPGSCKSYAQREAALRSGHLRCISYADLAASWQKVLPNCLNKRVQLFVSEFIDYMQRHLGASMSSRDSLIVEHAAKNEETVEAALRTAYAIGEVKRQLIQKFRLQLQRRFDESPLPREGWYLGFDLELSASKHSGISVAKSAIPTTANCRIRYVFGGADYNGLAYGVERRGTDAPAPSRAQLESALDPTDSEMKSDANSGLWPWWVEANTLQRDWRQAIEPWTSIASDQASLANEWIERAERMASALTQAGLAHFFTADGSADNSPANQTALPAISQ